MNKESLTKNNLFLRAGGARTRDASDIEVMTIIPTMTAVTSDQDPDPDHGKQKKIDLIYFLWHEMR